MKENHRSCILKRILLIRVEFGDTMILFGTYATSHSSSNIEITSTYPVTVNSSNQRGFLYLITLKYIIFIDPVRENYKRLQVPF